MTMEHQPASSCDSILKRSLGDSNGPPPHPGAVVHAWNALISLSLRTEASVSPFITERAKFHLAHERKRKIKPAHHKRTGDPSFVFLFCHRAEA